uniref:Uncharacterized protein n=1 Tax=Lutzomyia longipalpis TaxID=7200 RepID=A0A1B0CQF6_LUTLO
MPGLCTCHPGSRFTRSSTNCANFASTRRPEDSPFTTTANLEVTTQSACKFIRCWRTEGFCLLQGLLIDILDEFSVRRKGGHSSGQGEFLADSCFNGCNSLIQCLILTLGDLHIILVLLLLHIHARFLRCSLHTCKFRTCAHILMPGCIGIECQTWQGNNWREIFRGIPIKFSRCLILYRCPNDTPASLHLWQFNVALRDGFRWLHTGKLRDAPR